MRVVGYSRRHRAGMVERHTRKSQTLLPERACGFESRSRHTVIHPFDDAGVHPPQMRAQARALRTRGHSIHSVARTLSLPYATVWHWCVDRPEPVKRGTELRCFRCLPDVQNPTDPAAYAYLLGLYLGDGHLAISPKVPVLRIACTDSYPNLIDACEAAMLAVLAARVQRIPKRGCVSVESSGSTGRACSRSTGPGGSTSDQSSWPTGSAISLPRTRATSCVGCSTPTAAGSPTG